MQRLHKEERRRIVSEWFREHPYAVRDDIEAEPLIYYSIRVVYGPGRISDAQKDAGVPTFHERREREKEDEVQNERYEMILHLQENPGASIEDLAKAGYDVLSYDTNQLWKDAGLRPPHYISLAEAARMLDVKRQFTSSLAKRGYLPSWRVGRNVFTSSKAVRARKRQRQKAA